MNNNFYTVCVICSDDRAIKWGYVLSQTGRFSRVFLVRSHYDFQEILAGNIDSSLLPEDELPDTFDGIFFHSSNSDLWRSPSRPLKATCVFEFNTPGDPQPEKGTGTIPIKRQTAPYFGLKPQDIEELSEYITGTRNTLPLCCINALRPQILPSLVCLFYLYFSQVERGEQGMQPGFWREIWGELSESRTSAMLGQAWKSQLEREWKHEWRLVRSQSSTEKASIEKLLQAFIGDTDLVTPSLIDRADAALRDNLGLAQRSRNLQAKKPSAIEAIVALSDRTANHALAAVLSYLWGVPYDVVEFSKDNSKRIQRDRLLVISESQINLLKRMRMGGFSGAVLVISTDPFATLKQRHRVLRFGQGSHKSFPAPWNFEKLLLNISEMTPLAPENLQLLQKEIKASSLMCHNYIDPCRKQLDFIDGSSEVGDDYIASLENTVSKIRADLPVACHAVIKIETDQGEQRPLQIQEHFQIALNNIQSRDTCRISCGVNQFRQVFTQLQHYVIEAW